VEIKDAGPDPAIADLQTKLDDIETTLRNQTGQIEVMGHDLAGAKQDAADAKAAVAALSDRVDKLEKQLAALTTPPPPPPPPANEASVPPAEASAAPAAAGDPKAAYAQAKQLMLGGDYPGAAAAFQAYIDQHGDQSNIPTAHYWLGEVKFSQGDFNGAATNMIGAIRGWPQTSWAPDAMVKLSLALIQLNKTSDACGTLSEFAHHYPRASAAAKRRAAEARAKAGCER